MKDDIIYEVAKMWLPEESKGVIEVLSFANDHGEVFLHFDDSYSLHVSKQSLENLRALLTESIDALETLKVFDEFPPGLNKNNKLDNVLEFKRRDDD